MALALVGALYEPPAAGSYDLPPIGQVESRELVDSSGARVRFPALASGQVAIVAFIFRGCHDASGCPASLALLRELDRRLAEDPARASRVRLACVSFDPSNDTPDKMRDVMAPKTDWAFLTPADTAALAPLLADWGQDVTLLGSGEIRHVLKVFLVDDRGRIRNVYSAGVLDPGLVIADVDTLALEPR